jgi:hypothetical protein
MKKTLQISAHIDQPEFLQNLVERLAYRRYDLGYADQQMPRGFTALETSTNETYVSGSVSLELPGEEPGMESIRMPFITCFLFTCIKGKEEPYQLIWSTSLS